MLRKYLTNPKKEREKKSFDIEKQHIKEAISKLYI